MEEVIFSTHIVEKLNELTHILFDKEYFGFKESAEKYTMAIYDHIYKIPKLKHHKTIHSQWGHFYIKYKPQKSNTQYFITFDKKGDKYLIKNIFSNHTEEYVRFIK